MPTHVPPSAARPGQASHGRTSRFDHIVVVVEENRSYGEVLGSGQAPYLDSLAAQGTSYTAFHGETHPSEPNYVAMFSGSTQGLTDDSCPHTFFAGNLAAQLLSSGRSFTGYSEGLPQPGWTGCAAGNYARKHNPWSDFAGLAAHVNLPFSSFPSDFATLPSVAFVVPDVAHDMHDGTVSQGDTWLQTHLGPYATWARTHRSILVVTWDEDDFTPANHIPTVVVGAGVPAGRDARVVNHYSLLRSIEDAFGLSPLGAAATASPLAALG